MSKSRRPKGRDRWSKRVRMRPTAVEKMLESERQGQTYGSDYELKITGARSKDEETAMVRITEEARKRYPEIWAKSPAMAASKVMMEQGLDSDWDVKSYPQPGTLLQDLVRESLLDPERRLWGWKHMQKEGSADRAYVRRLGERIAAAKTIQLDDKMTEWLTRTSCWTPDMMERALRMARLPYDPMWIEFNEYTRQSTLLELGIGAGIDKLHTSPRSGYLLESLPQDDPTKPPIYRALSFHDMSPGHRDPSARAGVSAIGYYYSPEPGVENPLAHTADRDLHQASLRAAPKMFETGKMTDEVSPFGYAAMLWGSGWCRMHLPVNIKDYRTPDEFFDAVQKLEGGTKQLQHVMDTIMRIGQQVGYHCPPIWGGLARAFATGHDRRGREIERDMVRGAFNDVSGDLHFFLTLVALINTNAKHIDFEQVERTGSKQVFGKNMPYYRFNKVRLRLPGYQVEKVFRRSLTPRGGWHLPHHDVRGHWLYRSRSGIPEDHRRPKWCQHGEYHSWITDEEDSRKQKCAVCDYRRTWRTYPDGKGKRAEGFSHQEVEVERNEKIRPEEALA